MASKLYWQFLVVVLCALNAFRAEDSLTACPRSIQQPTSTSRDNSGCVQEQQSNPVTVDFEATHDSHLHQGGGASRTLLQSEGVDGVEASDFVCTLQAGLVNQFLDEVTGIWRIDDAALEVLGNDLQAVINCTREGDAVLFNVSRAVRPIARVTIPWRLTISAITERSEPVDGVFPRMETKTTFRCPRRNEGVFLIRSRDVLLANIQFRGCVFDSDEGTAIVKVKRCRSGTIEGTVQLHHVSFRRNRLLTASGLRVNSPACSAVEMVDVHFRNNECNEVCGAVLSTENSLREIVIRQNTQTGSTRTIPSILFAQPGSQTIARDINAHDNEGNVLRVRFGLLTLTNSSFTRNSADVSDRQNAFGASVHVADSVAFIEETIFEDNSGDFGSAVYSDRSNVTVISSDFERNSAIQGGAIYLQESSTGLFNSCTFFFNTAEHGGAIYASESDVTGLRESFLNNSARENGGCMYMTGSNLSISKSAFIQNMAMQGGVIAINAASAGLLAESVFDKNTAEDSGGAVYSDESQLTVTDCIAVENNGTAGGWIAAVQTSLDVRDSECANGFSTSGGCIFTRYSDAEIRNVSMTSSHAEVNGGALRIDRSTVTITDSTFISNFAALSGGGVSSTESELNVNNTAFMNNTALTGGGGVYAGEHGFVNVVDSSFTVNTAEHGAGMYVLRNTTGNVTACLFERNVGRRSGGALCIETAFVWIFGIQFFANNAAFGGALYGTTGAQLRVADSVCINGTARIGGCLATAADSITHVHNVVLQHNRATENGGALYSEDSVMLVTRCSFISNGAVNGGGIFTYKTDLECSEVIFDNGAARTNGGAMYCEDGSIRTTNASFIGNSARYGGALMLLTAVDGSFVNVNYTRNRASISGAAAYVQEATVVLDNARFIANIARDGGCFVVFTAVMNITNSDFVNGTATATGGFVYALENSTIRMQDVTMSKSNADRGGAVAMSSSYFGAERLHISQCRTRLDGGGIFARGASVVHCTDCMLEHNDAHGRGGAVNVQSNQTEGIAVRFYDCTFQDNRGEYGGGLYFVSTHGTIDCSEPRARCPYAALSGTVFRRNRALSAGGAIFTNDVNAVRISCLSDNQNVGLSTTDMKELASMNILNTLDNVCQNWTGNHAIVYGEMIASYATDMKKMVVYEDRNESITVRGSRHVVENHAAGTQLPTVSLQVCDDLGQGPAIGSRNITTEATMSSSDGLLIGSLIVPLTGGSGELTAISQIRPPGRYNIHVDFSEDSLETFHLMVDVRGCVVGEELTGDGSSCRTCNAEMFNFFPDTSGCQSCPEDGNCLENGIRPRKGHWNQMACSTQVQRCLTKEACDYDGRDERLSEFTRDLQDCTIDTQSIQEYNEAECAEGHTGPLCGSCKDSYGKSQSLKCEECFSDVANIVVVVVSLTVLLGLAAFTVGSNVIQFSGTNKKSNKTNSQPQTPTSGSVSVNMPQIEYQSAEQSSRPGTPRASHPMSNDTVREAELAKWKAIELFKLTLHFLQVTALAVAINVDWSVPLLAMFTTAEVASGVTCEATNRSVDCLLSDDPAIPRSVIGHYIDALLPLGVIGLFAAYWAVHTIKNRKTVFFWAKRSILSIIAVLFVSYTSLSLTIVSSLDCVEVHDSTSILFESTSNYWAVDTSLRCYDGSHAVLAGAVGWPFLILFIFGFPLVMAYVIVKYNKDDYQDGGLYEVAGFMYRSYGSKYIFWESVIMLRKATLAVVVVFAYQLGTKQQIALSAFILILALYAQVMCQPFRQEFRVLNEMEGTSLLISLLTFLSSLLFKDEDIDSPIRIFVTVVICICNVWLLLYFILFFFVFTAKYLKFVLDREGVAYDPKGDTRHILKVYLWDYLADDIREESYKVFKRMVGRQRSCTCS